MCTSIYEILRTIYADTPLQEHFSSRTHQYHQLVQNLKIHTKGQEYLYTITKFFGNQVILNVNVRISKPRNEQITFIFFTTSIVNRVVCGSLEHIILYGTAQITNKVCKYKFKVTRTTVVNNNLTMAFLLYTDALLLWFTLPHHISRYIGWEGDNANCLM